jgi:hypothetical protein
MRAPKNPPALVVMSAAALVLTQHEAELLSAFRAMDERRQRENLRFMMNTAKRFPRGPWLRLVTGGRA